MREVGLRPVMSSILQDLKIFVILFLRYLAICDSNVKGNIDCSIFQHSKPKFKWASLETSRIYRN